MAFGLKTWNAGGVLTLDTSDRITAYYGGIGWTIPGGTYRVNLYVPGANPATWFAYTNTDFHVADVITDYVRITYCVQNHPSDTSGAVFIFKG